MLLRFGIGLALVMHGCAGAPLRSDADAPLPPSVALGSSSFFVMEYGSASELLELAPDGSYSAIAREHAGLFERDRGRWKQTPRGELLMCSHRGRAPRGRATAEDADEDLLRAWPLRHRNTVFLWWTAGPRSKRFGAHEICTRIDEARADGIPFLIHVRIPEDEFRKEMTSLQPFRFYPEMNGRWPVGSVKRLAASDRTLPRCASFGADHVATPLASSASPAGSDCALSGEVESHELVPAVPTQFSNGMTVTISQASWDHFQDGSFSVWVNLLFRRGTKESTVAVDVRRAVCGETDGVTWRLADHVLSIPLAP